jgi:lysylphosphatidylglycerol synthetase-like protein (DUF2156 family)
MSGRLIVGIQAKSLGRKEKWALLSPHLRLHGREALSYATLQDGLEYFLHDKGYIAFTTVRHAVFSRRPKAIVLSDPVCVAGDYRRIIADFLVQSPDAVFTVVSEACAAVLREFGYKANCVGYEPELDIQSYNTKGDWKELDLIKRARNEARREGYVIREEKNIEQVDCAALDQVTAQWLSNKRVNDREIWVYARRPVYGLEPDVRKFVAYDRDGRVIGFVFYDPMYRDGRVYGYAASISRCDEKRFGRLSTAIHMTAMDLFKPEGKEVLNLCLATFVKLDAGRFNDDWSMKMFFQLSERFGDNIYNFKGLSFNKSKYRGREKSLYCASNRFIASNDIYLAFLSSDITRSYFSTLGRLLWGILTALRQPPAK